MLASRLVVGVLFVGVTIPGAVVCGQDYPNKPVRILTGAPGGSTDFLSRQIAQEISVTLGQPVIVENRPNIVLGEIGSKAPPDGYTLLVAGGGFWTGPLLRPTPYDPVRDFSAITQVERSPNILVVHPSLPVKSVRELIALAKGKPGEINYASSTPGSSAHLAAELFKDMAGVNIVWVPYKGSAPANTAVIAGETQVMFAPTTSVMPHVKSSRLRALAVTSATPSALTPGLPTVAASGVPSYESVGMTAIFAPVKTPATAINRLNREIVRALNQTELRVRLFDAGLEPVGSSPEQTAATLKAEIAKLDKIIKAIRDAGVKLE